MEGSTYFAASPDWMKKEPQRQGIRTDEIEWENDLYDWTNSYTTSSYFIYLRLLLIWTPLNSQSTCMRKEINVISSHYESVGILKH